MKEGKVIKIMRRQQRELVGVLQSVRAELALFQRCGFSSSELRVCVFLASLTCRGIQQPEAAISSLSLLSTSFNLIHRSPPVPICFLSSLCGLTFDALAFPWMSLVCSPSLPPLGSSNQCHQVLRG